VHGTTGYEFMNQLNGVFVMKDNEKVITLETSNTHRHQSFREIYAKITGKEYDFEDILFECKHLVMKISFQSELKSLTNMLFSIAQQNRNTRDFTPRQLKRALTAFLACIPGNKFSCVVI
jgi:(1->4)-alpha-D-glucan 1-alpha-D-glucosylmutase